jgi:hypothetical protein
MVLRGFAVLVMALALMLAPPARAQLTEIEGPDYLVWEVLAELAESALENRNTTDEELTLLRAEVDASRAAVPDGPRCKPGPDRHSARTD